MRYQLIATDLDGTLLNKQARVSAENKAAIQSAAEKGVKTVICSGRSYMSLARFEKEIGNLAEGNYGIGFNGGMVYETHNRNILMEKRMPNALAQRIIRDLKQVCAARDILVYAGDVLMVEEETPDIIHYRNTAGIDLTKVRFEDIKQDVSKILLRGSFDFLRRVQEQMRPHIRDHANMVFSASTLLEFCGPGIDKAYGLRFICDYLQIPIAKTIAIGDNENDIPMLAAAGLGIAVRNATPQTKAAADFVTDADHYEHAIREVVERFIGG